MRFFLAIAFITMSWALQAQDFNALIQEGGELYKQEQYLESAEKYSAALELEEGNSGQYYNAACSWALAGNADKALEYLQLSADKGWHNLKHIQSDKDLQSLRENEAWASVLDKVQANKDEYEKDFNKPLKAQLEQIYVRDQTLRQLYRDAEEKFGRESDEMKYFWELVSEQDRRNEEEVMAIIDEHGWVGRSEVGGQANMTLWLVIQHAPLPTQEKYLPLLEASVKQGESSGSHLALLEDRILMRNDQPQTYGSQIRTDPETGAQYVYEVREPEYVNQRRAAVGLGPIEDYVKRWGIEWTVEQKEK
ncbi:DUF6624 domain-containing protein [Flavilitoribacter nigricans]|uniref:Uncharacterized protein n=1 Tax=Flavilitoribacter nigricans (strain ATCC 23147 / DSM 23189 / NBRC 102662 / NCIMB 1420 / SS-2) TaxID=1122177 RepID=A0A2D0MWT0_FLAN2|nr:DUF6624 domain-containing protein [Flavilitoribacter nigricans]PHN00695.1 hypothetical protein CRP01_40950 [Flavilitoribacter nigricans DSM 23189 = NBRC 102662]